jgi:DNA-directed RNA polymerase delta subunit
MNHHGGVMTEEALLESLLSVHVDQPQYRQAVGFILSELMNDKIAELPKSKKYVRGWKLKLTSMEFVDAAIVELENVIRNAGKPQSYADVLRQFQTTEFYKQNDQKLTEDAVLSYVDLSSQLARNPFDEYGLTEWGLVSPKRMNDRVYLVLKKEHKPMHFEEIAKRISKIFKKPAYPPTVHNELILNSEYVLVGRGIYALKEWGFKEGVVSDVLVDILKRANRPMQRNELVDSVLKQRMVKKNTILLALADKTLFTKTKDGKFTLAPQTPQSAPIDSPAPTQPPTETPPAPPAMS